MAWFKLDDQVAFGAKTIAAGNEAFGAWCRAGAWSSAHLTEGFIPDDVARTIAPPRVWKRLLEAKAGKDFGLVERSDGGWTIHDFLQWNPTAEEVIETRAKGRNRVNSFRKRQRENDPCNADCNGGVTRYIGVCNAPVTHAPSPSPSPSQERELTSRRLDARSLQGEADARASFSAPGFDRFREAYPRKDRMEIAEETWNRIRPDPDAVCDHLKRQCASPQWQEQNGRFVPQPDKYLERQEWTSAVKETEKEPKSWAGIRAAFTS